MIGLASELTPQSLPSEAHSLPVIGEIAAGGPIEAYQDASETLAVPDILAPAGDAYVLRVRGDSMIEAHIADGDFVVIRPQETARDGDIVVAQVEENAVTLKRFFREKDRVRLQPANPQLPAAVLPVGPDPGEADRRHPPPGLSARVMRPIRALPRCAPRSRTPGALAPVLARRLRLGAPDGRSRDAVHGGCPHSVHSRQARGRTLGARRLVDQARSDRRPCRTAHASSESHAL